MIFVSLIRPYCARSFVCSVQPLFRHCLHFVLSVIRFHWRTQDASHVPTVRIQLLFQKSAPAKRSQISCICVDDAMRCLHNITHNGVSGWVVCNAQSVWRRTLVWRCWSKSNKDSVTTALGEVQRMANWIEYTQTHIDPWTMVVLYIHHSTFKL